MGETLAIIFFILYMFVHFTIILTVIKIISTVIKSIFRANIHRDFKNNVIEFPKQRYVDISKEQLSKFNTENLNELKDYVFNIFTKFEYAYNNLDYKVMESLSTKQLFQNYYTGITLDLNVGRKRIIENIQKKKVIIYELDSTIAKQVLSAMIEISYINYVIDKDGNVTSGDREKPMTEKFEVIFRKDYGKDNVKKCPNCGANMEGSICDFCRTRIKSSDFVISSIKKIIEK